MIDLRLSTCSMTIFFLFFFVHKQDKSGRLQRSKFLNKLMENFECWSDRAKRGQNAEEHPHRQGMPVNVPHKPQHQNLRFGSQLKRNKVLLPAFCSCTPHAKLLFAAWHCTKSCVGMTPSCSEVPALHREIWTNPLQSARTLSDRLLDGGARLVGHEADHAEDNEASKDGRAAVQHRQDARVSAKNNAKYPSSVNTFHNCKKFFAKVIRTREL